MTGRDASPSLPLDVIYGLLSNERRRFVIRYLASRSGPTTLGDLAERLASIERDTPESQLTSRERKNVYVVLYQCHLPKLDDADVVDFDEARKTVTLGPNFDVVAAHLDPDSGDDGGPDGRLQVVATGVAAVVLVVIGGLALSDGWLLGILLGVTVAVIVGIATFATG